jgi:hypothetical protein
MSHILVLYVQLDSGNFLDSFESPNYIILLKIWLKNKTKQNKMIKSVLEGETSSSRQDRVNITISLLLIIIKHCRWNIQVISKD